MRKYLKILLLTVIMLFCMTGCSENPSEEGLLFLQEAKYEDAITQFEDAIEQEINVADAYRGIGIARWELEDYEGARDAFAEALANGAEGTATIYNFLGTCELKMLNYNMALNYYRLGMEEECSDQMMQEMRFNEIVCYEALEDWENAKTKIKKYAADYPDDERAAKEAEFFETR